ncbi:MAG TPA: hypothetical protein VMC83_42715 [Streptosporangiaceae bacterium]|nr:hypothetical protein [Streptosporangiaceae bacterium]
MALFRSRSHDDKVLWSLTKAIRLLLPADPGFDRMLDACQQYQPSARPSRMNHDWICADGQHFRVHGANAVSPDMAAQAGLPGDITCVFYVDWDGAELGLNTQQRKRLAGPYAQKAGYVLGGLAARFGGLWAPHPTEVTQPLRAYVLTTRDIDAAGLLGMASRYAPGLALGDPRSDKVIALHGDVPSRVQYWPPYSAAVPKSELIAGPEAPLVLDGSWPDDDTGVIVVGSDQAAAGADPSVARAVGTMALGLAEQTGGLCLDIFGFRVRAPADLVIRAG